MTLDELAAIAAKRTKGRWHVGHINESLDRGEIESDGIIIASDCKRNDEPFICTMANHADALIAIARATAEYLNDKTESVGLNTMVETLAALEKE